MYYFIKVYLFRHFRLLPFSADPYVFLILLLYTVTSCFLDYLQNENFEQLPEIKITITTKRKIIQKSDFCITLIELLST